MLTQRCDEPGCTFAIGTIPTEDGNSLVVRHYWTEEEVPLIGRRRRAVVTAHRLLAEAVWALEFVSVSCRRICWRIIRVYPD